MTLCASSARLLACTSQAGPKVSQQKPKASLCLSTVALFSKGILIPGDPQESLTHMYPAIHVT